MKRGREYGLVWIETAAAVIYSCYISPNCSNEEFDEFVARLAGSIEAHEEAKELIVVTGDFSAYAVEWGSRDTPVREKLRRGEVLLETMSRRRLSLANDRRRPTYRSRGTESFLDLTFYSEESACGVEEWEVLDEETMSDHRYISFSIRTGSAMGGGPQRRETRWRWKPRKVDLDKVREVVLYRCSRDQPTTLNPKQLSSILEEACLESSQGRPQDGIIRGYQCTGGRRKLRQQGSNAYIYIA